jgi:hypothetical protein
MMPMKPSPATQRICANSCIKALCIAAATLIWPLDVRAERILTIMCEGWGTEIFEIDVAKRSVWVVRSNKAAADVSIDDLKIRFEHEYHSDGALHSTSWNINRRTGDASIHHQYRYDGRLSLGNTRSAKCAPTEPVTRKF